MNALVGVVKCIMFLCLKCRARLLALVCSVCMLEVLGLRRENRLVSTDISLCQSMWRISARSAVIINVWEEGDRSGLDE